MAESRITEDALLPHADAVLELLNVAEAAGAVCAMLTPSIKARLKEMEPGQVLLVRVDDPSACLDVTAWCDLTGHPLQATYEQDGVFGFFIRKRDKKQEVQGNG